MGRTSEEWKTLKRFMHKKWARGKPQNLKIRTVYAYKTCERKRNMLVKNDLGFSMLSQRDIKKEDFQKKEANDEKLFAWIKESGGVWMGNRLLETKCDVDG
jgi:hypothetical protein